MASEDNLFDTFRAGEIDAADLSQIALAHFHTATDDSSTEVLFGVGPVGPDREKYALKFVYRKQRLAKILAGPSLTTEDVSAIRSKVDSEIQQPAAVKVSTRVLFTHLSVEGWFRYRDILQIVPIPTGSPRGNSLFGGNPFLVQFKFRPSSDPWLYTFRREVQGRKVHLLLNALLETSISRLGGSRFHWVLLPTRANEPLTTAYYQEMHAFSDSGKFSDSDSFAPADGIGPLAGIPPQEYYTRTLAINDPARVLEVPSNFETLLDRFYSSSEDEQDRFIRACFWFYHAQTVFADSRSAAFTAFISAIEALMPSEKPLGKCPICQRSVGKGSIRRLAEFLDQFAPATPAFQEARAQLYYEFRSRLAHGGALTFSDRSASFAGLIPEAIEEGRLNSEAWQPVKLVLVNWLHARCPLLLTVHRG